LGDPSVVDGLDSFERRGVEKPRSDGEPKSEAARVLEFVNRSMGSAAESARGVDASERELGVDPDSFLVFGASCNLNLSLDAGSLLRASCCDKRGESSDRRGRSASAYGDALVEQDLLRFPPDRLLSVASREDCRPFS
jgi:hypothetical protein